MGRVTLAVAPRYLFPTLPGDSPIPDPEGGLHRLSFSDLGCLPGVLASRSTPGEQKLPRTNLYVDRRISLAPLENVPLRASGQSGIEQVVGWYPDCFQPVTP